MLCTTSMVERMEVTGEPVENNRLSLSTTELLSMSDEITILLHTKDKKNEVDDGYSETISDLEQQVDSLTNKLNSCKERNQSELEYYNLVLENRNEEIQQMQKTQLEKESEMKELKKTLRSQESELDQKNNLLNRYQHEIEDLKEELEKQTKKLNTLKAEKEKFVKETQAECEEKANRIVSFDDNISVKTFEVDDPTEALQKEINRMRNENEKLKAKLGELKWQMKAKDIMISNSEDTVELMENQNEQIEMLQERIDELEEQLSMRSETEVNNNNETNSELESWKERVKELEMKLNEQNTKNKPIPPMVLPKPVKEKQSVFKEEIIEATVEETTNMAPINNDEFGENRQTEYLKMLQELRDSFYTELDLNTENNQINGKGKFECLMEDLRIVLGSLRLKLSNVLEESLKENNKEVQRMQSLKRMNTTLKEEIQQKTQNYGNTVKSLEVQNAALSKSMIVQQQLNEELSDQMKENERDHLAIANQVNDLKLKMMVRDSEVDRLKNILEGLKKNKNKNKKIGKKDKKKSNSLSNLLK